ncbi:uncharacterized protein LOC135940905 isoform X2 [Cloeon dipterum]|uniref:uncharacterized protein LOC135940905 isoform X2 n=1 Tax=Cloeon dipterum TaxID=197152 RepID=UPI00321FE29E
MYGKGSGRPGREDDSQVCHAVVGVERAQDASPAPHLEPRGLLPVSRTSVAAALSGRLGAMRPPVVAREHSPCAGPSHKGVGIGQQGARGCPGGGQRPHQLKFLFDDVKRATLAHQMGAHFKAAYAVDPSPDAASSRAGFALASDNERSTAAPKRPLAQLQPNATGLAQSLPCHNPGSAELPPPAKPARRGDTLSVARSAPCKLLAVPDAGSHIGSMKRKAMRKISLGENAHQLEVVHSETDSPLRKKTFKRKCNIPFCDSNERKDAAVKFFTVTTVRKLREEYYRFCEMASDRYRRPPNPRYAIYCCYLHYDGSTCGLTIPRTKPFSKLQNQGGNFLIVRAKTTIGLRVYPAIMMANRTTIRKNWKRSSLSVLRHDQQLNQFHPQAQISSLAMIQSRLHRATGHHLS